MKMVMFFEAQVPRSSLLSYSVGSNVLTLHITAIGEGSAAALMGMTLEDRPCIAEPESGDDDAKLLFSFSTDMIAVLRRVQQVALPSE